MIRRAVLQDIPALMDIYNEAILHTTATFDTEVKDMENRKAWFAEHNGRYVIYVDVEDGKVAGYASLSRYRDRKAFDPCGGDIDLCTQGLSRAWHRPQPDGESACLCSRV